MNNPIKYLYLIPAGIVICTILSVISSCSADDNPPGDTLPAGKYPMTFTTSVGELVVTRGTADNSQWAGTEKVAIQLGNDAASYGEIKEYKAATDGELTPANNAAPLYWRNTTETITAWYPYSTARPTSFTVQENQNTGDNYQTSDFLYTTGTYTYKSSGACALVFKHLPVKVVINLTNGDGINQDDLKNATVSLVSQSLTSGAISTDWTVANLSGNAEITSYALATPTTNYQKTVQALLVPQDIANKKFIKVTIGTVDDTRDYYFTPAADAAALAAGTQYTYNITVRKDKLEVVTLAGLWTDQTTQGTDPEATFKIHMPDAFNSLGITVTDANGNEVNKETDGSAYTTSSKTVKVSIPANATTYASYLKKLISVEAYGICALQFLYTQTSEEIAASEGTYTYTLSDIRSDIWLNATINPDELKVGDYYYDDGTWSAALNSAKKCIGVVFQVGAKNNDTPAAYDGKIIHAIRGYVVALNDAHEKLGAWGYRTNDVTGITNLDVDNFPSDDSWPYDGYTNTKAVRGLSEYATTDVTDPYGLPKQYWAFKVAVEYDKKVTTPVRSSGWYLPSIQQLKDITTNTNLPTLLTGASGVDFIRSTRYWSSSEKHEADAWFCTLSSNSVEPGAYAKSNDSPEKKDPFSGTWLPDLSGGHVRSILTF